MATPFADQLRHTAAGISGQLNQVVEQLLPIAEAIATTAVTKDDRSEVPRLAFEACRKLLLRWVGQAPADRIVTERYVRAVIHNHVRNWYRSERRAFRFAELAFEPPDDRGEDTDWKADLPGLLARLQHGLECLSTEDRELIELHYLRQQSFAAIADRLSIRKTTVFDRVAAALVRLRTHI